MSRIENVINKHCKYVEKFMGRKNELHSEATDTAR